MFSSPWCYTKRCYFRSWIHCNSLWWLVAHSFYHFGVLEMCNFYLVYPLSCVLMHKCALSFLSVAHVLPLHCFLLWVPLLCCFNRIKRSFFIEHLATKNCVIYVTFQHSQTSLSSKKYSEWMLYKYKKNNIFILHRQI